MDLDDLARRWWASGYGGEPEYGEIERLLSENPDRLSLLVRALVDAAPADQSIAYIGTTVLEDIFDEMPPERVARLLRESGVSRPQLDEILSGMWAELRGPITQAL